MHAGHDVPDMFFTRILSAGGPYGANDAVAIAYATPSVGRLVAIDATVRARCANYERSAIPEVVSVVVEHSAATYVAGETLTLYFVDPGIARIQRDASRGPAALEDAAISYLSQNAARSSAQVREGEPMTLRADDRLTDPDMKGELVPPESTAAQDAPRDERVAHVTTTFERSKESDPPPTDDAAPEDVSAGRPGESEAGILIRLEWNAERVRRFIQVVDRLFTIDRLGWYRHSLAMRLLIPDEIRSGDELADVEAMRHLHALRSASLSVLGKPLLAACMPGFSVTSDWLETLESSREARAIAGLRDALLPYATDRADDTNDRSGTRDAAYTFGAVGKRALLAENAMSVESFLPILIPTASNDLALGARLTEYRDLLLELFGQIARATDPVRLGALAQPNHSLDDRLWQLVGAVGEAFGGFVRT